MTLPESQAIRNLQSDFRTDDTCYYWIEASPLIAEGGIMSVNFFLMKNVDIFIAGKRKESAEINKKYIAKLPGIELNLPAIHHHNSRKKYSPRIDTRDAIFNL